MSSRQSKQVFERGLAVAGSVAAQASDRRAAISIENFGRINDRYYRGAQPTGHDYVDLAALGVKTVIDLTEDGDVNESGMVQSTGMKLYRIPMTTHAEPAPQSVAQFLKLVNDPANQPVYVHCQGGRHRTGIMTAVYRMTEDGWSADRAFGEMQQYGFGPAFLHSALKDFVYGYYAQIDRSTIPLHPDVVATKAASTAGVTEHPLQ
jgi:tyrosine-protein phosphatase SIW14